jgi:site-specific DNA-cytosine methylase
MKVLSLFDGMSCGRIALERVGIPVEKYYASEIKPHAIEVTKHNYPDTIHVGDVTKLDLNNYKDVDLLIGGSTCQDFSRGNKESSGLDGVKSSLFFKWLEAKEVIKPKYFFLENVVMDMEDKQLGVMPVRINSALVSAQLRDRNYWTNIPGNGGLFGDMIDQPDDKEIFLNDIIDFGYSPMNKERCLLESDSRRLTTPIKMFHRFYSTGFTTLIFKDINHYDKCKFHYDEWFNGCSASDIDETIKEGWREGLRDSTFDEVRYMNQSELERCQTVQEGYTEILIRDDAACLLGDGWTVDVIAHIFKGLNK